MNLKGNLTSKGLQGSIVKSRMQGILGTNPAAIPITVDNALSFSSTNPVQNKVITQAITGRLLSDDVKAALLQIAQKVAYIDAQGQDYYDDLYDALYPPIGLDSIGAVFDAGGATIYDTATLNDLKQYLTVTAYYTDGTSDVLESTDYTLTGTIAAGNQTITVSYGGKTTTFTVTVVEWLTSISAVYTQPGAVFPSDGIDSLKSDLVVTANYADTSSATIASADYTLSGELAAGTSTITVTYGGKTTTFTVTVTAWTLEWSTADGGLPTSVASDDWQKSESGSSSSHTVTFDQTNGIKWVGKGGSYNIWPKNYTNASDSVFELVINFETITSITDIMLFLANTSDSLIAMLYQDGIHVNYAANPAIAGTTFTENTDYTIRLERTSNSGKVTLNGTLIYDGEIRTGRTDTNMITLTATTSGSTWTGYIKAIRYLSV